MLAKTEFEKKQIVMLFANHGEKLTFKNDNLVVLDKDKKTKFQTTCYRVIALFVIGSMSITTGLIQRAKKFGFVIVLMTTNIKVYDYLGFEVEGNTLLHKAQFSQTKEVSLQIAKKIVSNKIINQRIALMRQRYRGDKENEVILKLKKFAEASYDAQSIQEIMGLEGSAARIYFPVQFNNCEWKGRQPRAKLDYINSTLDIGYTLLFNYIEALLRLYGFDTYLGNLHQEFYKRKSLVCDMVEPFRPLVDLQVRKSIGLKQCSSEDFDLRGGQYRLKTEKSKEYILFLLNPLLDYKDDMYLFVGDYYKWLLSGKIIDEFPQFNIK